MNSSGDPKGLGALYGDGHVIFNTNQEIFDEELWGTRADPTVPDWELSLWFPIIQRLGNNVPDPLIYDGNPSTAVWENADAWECNERLEDGAKTGGGEYKYAN